MPIETNESVAGTPGGVTDVVQIRPTLASVTSVLEIHDGGSYRVELTRSCGHLMHWCGAPEHAPRVGDVSECLTCWSAYLSRMDGLELVSYGAGFAWLRAEEAAAS